MEIQTMVNEIIIESLFENRQSPMLNDEYLQFYQGITQIKVYDQYNSNLCGFHSLFNAQCIIDYFLNNKNNSSLNMLNSSNAQNIFKRNCFKYQHHFIQNISSFWNCYYSTYQFLIEQYPNKQDIKYLENLGPLDRSHLEFIIENYQPILEKQQQCLQSNIDLILLPFYYGFGIVQLSEEQVDQFNEIVNRFNESNRDTLVIIFAGTTNHWITYVAYKEIQTNKKQFYFLDSANLVLRDLLLENIESLLTNIEQKQQERGVKENPSNKESSKSTMITALKDRKTVLQLLNDCFLEKIRLEVFMIENQFKEMLVTFVEYFPNWQEMIKQSDFEEIKKQDNEVSLEILGTFIKCEYRPQVIENDILKVMKKYIGDVEKYFNKELSQNIISWVDLNVFYSQLLINIVKDNQELLIMVEKYIKVISDIKQILININ